MNRAIIKNEMNKTMAHINETIAEYEVKKTNSEYKINKSIAQSCRVFEQLVKSPLNDAYSAYLYYFPKTVRNNIDIFPKFKNSQLERQENQIWEHNIMTRGVRNNIDIFPKFKNS